MHTPFKRLSLMVVFLALLPQATFSSTANEDELPAPESYQHRWRYLRTGALIVGFNVIMTSYGRFIMAPESESFRVSPHTIKENLIAGMEWDDNTFSANNFRHPYQGGVYFNIARSNGFDFYQSSLASFAGAWLFEYAGEAHHPSFNDWINTSVGGIFLGESVWRLSSMVFDNEARGIDRVSREISGFFINPVRGINRLITGETYHVHKNPPEHKPPTFQGRLRTGVRTIGTEKLWNLPNTKAFISADFTYGSAKEAIKGDPFEYFDFGAQLTFDNNPYAIEYITGNALIKGWEKYGEGGTIHTTGAFLHWDYTENEAFTFGGQSMSIGYKVTCFCKKPVQVSWKAHLEGIMLGAAKSDYFNLSGREYDYGPGLGARTGLRFVTGGRPFLSIDYKAAWIKSINGTICNHIMHYGSARIDALLFEHVEMGLEYSLYYVDRFYDKSNYFDISSRTPRLKAYITWLSY
jgi:hypothetical protein